MDATTIAAHANNYKLDTCTENLEHFYIQQKQRNFSDANKIKGRVMLLLTYK
jgi:hypothetical protein